MLSILVPVFNYDCTELVNELAHSCVLAKVNFEIIIGNDCSNAPEVLKALERLNRHDFCNVVNKEKNIGRAFILNEMSQYARYPFLLIIDSDARLAEDDFIEKYIQVAVAHDVVCGGIEVRPQDRTSDNLLRYRYEHGAAKSRALDYRKKHPYERFSTFNLLIRKRVFDSIKFDQCCYQYGYEDTVLGLDLMRRKIDVLHINNPLIHTGIDSNRSFLSKTRQSLEVLVGLDLFYQEHIRLSRVALAFKRRHAMWLVVLWHTLFGRMEFRSLMRWPNINIFYLYKLGYFCCLLNKRAKGS